MHKTRAAFFFFLFFNGVVSAQNYYSIGLNAGLRTTGLYTDFLFLKRFEIQVGNEFQRYNGLAVYGQLRGFVFRTNLENRSVFLSLGYNDFFGRNSNFKYEQKRYTYKIRENRYIIPGIGIKFLLDSIHHERRIKTGFISINLTYRFNQKPINMFQLVDPSSAPSELDNRLGDFYAGGLGIYVSYSVTLGKRDK
jgi:hypothetical protein